MVSSSQGQPRPRPRPRPHTAARRRLRRGATLAIALAVACTALAAAAVLPHVAAHSRLFCPTARSPRTDLKLGPCGGIAQVTPVTTLNPGPQTIIWQESIRHVGAPWRIELAAPGDPDAACVLLDHVPHNPASTPSFNNEATWTQYKLTVTIPDVACTACSLRISNPMTDKIPAGTSCTDPGTCDSVYHSCSAVSITGETPFADYVCPAQPADWPFRQLTMHQYTQESSAWSNDGWLNVAPASYKVPTGFCVGDAQSGGAGGDGNAANSPGGGSGRPAGSVTTTLRINGITPSELSSGTNEAVVSGAVAGIVSVPFDDVEVLGVTPVDGDASAANIQVAVLVPDKAAAGAATIALVQSVNDGSMTATLRLLYDDGVSASIATAPVIAGITDAAGDPLAGQELAHMGNEVGGWLNAVFVAPVFAVVFYACRRINARGLAAAAAAVGGAVLSSDDKNVADKDYFRRFQWLTLSQGVVAFFSGFWTWWIAMLTYVVLCLAIHAFAGRRAVPHADFKGTQDVGAIDVRVVAVYVGWCCVSAISALVDYGYLGSWIGTCADAGDYCDNAQGSYCSMCGYADFMAFIATVQLLVGAAGAALGFMCFKEVRAAQAAGSAEEQPQFATLCCLMTRAVRAELPPPMGTASKAGSDAAPTVNPVHSAAAAAALAGDLSTTAEGGGGGAAGVGGGVGGGGGGGGGAGAGSAPAAARAAPPPPARPSPATAAETAPGPAAGDASTRAPEKSASGMITVEL